MPLDTSILLAAREWSVPPWEVESGPAYWFFRWQEETKLRSKIENNPTLPDD